MLSKETAIILLAAVYAFFVLRPEVRVRWRQLLLAGGVMAAVVGVFPLALLIAGRTETGGNYLAWQLFRQANHDLFFYPLTVPLAIGPALVLLAALGLWVLRRRHDWRETLLLAWVAAPLTFFELYPIKGFQYLLPIAPAVALLAARTVALWPAALLPRGLRRAWVGPVAVGLVAVTLAVPSWLRVEPSRATSFLAGSGGVPGGREAGEWIARNVPTGAQLMTIGPSMANILQFYGGHPAYALSVSTNPLQPQPHLQADPQSRPAVPQQPVPVRRLGRVLGRAQLVLLPRLLRYADRYSGRVVHSESVTTQSGAKKPVVVVYEVHP